ncbi:hypothetical protein WQ57_11565 [Mesobacillus campisalis]|uniref:Uncharacterized protein n=1 Tax=Mesobacillus campisalis TaxID=1408103 RepID=A0A0M2SUI5_9BACI|nr:hypothetical protein [Mesobacillus campisalis]KKK37808.1 hypothetical protein WQ57_11565 [Mesobacillus campisalis]
MPEDKKPAAIIYYPKTKAVASSNQAVFRENFLENALQEQQKLANKLVEFHSANAQKSEMYNDVLLEQVILQEKLLRDMNRKLAEYEKTTASLNEQLKHQVKMREVLERHDDLQNVYHKTVMEALDSHEANAEKLDRKLDFIKSSIFERAADLSEKMDGHFNRFANFMLNLFTKRGIQRIGQKENDRDIVN